MAFTPEILRGVKTEFEALDRLPTEMKRPGGFGDLGDLPLIVVRRGKTEQPPSEADLRHQRVQENLAKLSKNSALIVAQNSGHHPAGRAGSGRRRCPPHAGRTTLERGRTMNANDLIESYVIDVAVQLPRKQRNDVAFELRALLNEGLQDKAEAAGRHVDATMATEFLRAFGRPADVAARYRPTLTIIDPRTDPDFCARLSSAWR